MNGWKIPLFALTLATLISTTAYAEGGQDGNHPPYKQFSERDFQDQREQPGFGGPERPDGNNGVGDGRGGGRWNNRGKGGDNGEGFDFLDENKVNELKNMSPEDRQKFFMERAKKIDEMSPEQIEQYKEKRKAWFNSLPPEKQDKVREKFQTLRQERMQERKEWFSKLSDEEKQQFIAERKAKMEERMKNMPPEERQKFFEKMKERRGDRNGEGPRFKRPGFDGQEGKGREDGGRWRNRGNGDNNGVGDGMGGGRWRNRGNGDNNGVGDGMGGGRWRNRGGGGGHE